MVKLMESNGQRQSGPTDRRGMVLALIAALAAFTLMLWVETERIVLVAETHRVNLGPPIVGRLYPPFASLSWMVEVERPFDFSLSFAPSQQKAAQPQEKRWAREAFAGERARIPWEGGVALLIFFVGSAFGLRVLPTSGARGDARWAAAEDVRRSALVQGEIGVVLGEEPQTKRLLIHPGPQNVLAIGPPGVGKSDGIAVPTLMRTWPHSAIVFDPAGELRERTASVRAYTGKVVVFDPRDPNSARFNPIAGIEATNIDAIRMVLASYMFGRDPSKMHETARFFLDKALDLGIALVARAIEINAANGVEASLADAAQLYYDGGCKSDKQFCASLMESAIEYVKGTGSSYERMDERLRSNVIGTLTQFFGIFRSDDIANSVSDSDFSAETMRREQTTLYLIVRERDHAALNPILRMVLTRLLDDLTARKVEDHEQSVLLMLDEFPLLKAPIIEQKLATARKFRILSVLLAQAMTQIREYYGVNESVTGMCDVRVFYPTLDRTTQEFASNTCGEMTQWSETFNTDRRSQWRTMNEMGRALLLPSDLATLGDRIVVTKKGEPPILAVPVRAYADERFRTL